MTLKQFFILAIMCSLETYFLADAFFRQWYWLVGFWAIFLLQNLRKAYIISKWTRYFNSSTKKKE
ncbi:DUF3272 family protein [Streptococcus pacificus]|uniref:DUF3272 family protein n=1 Tax=Streptococcus pacificus TaxID=2740577 RepID=A0ABS0ZIU6_9STRE|nr:DUF3272 family protein [Streptococcus pacificus]MBJ8325940.1 DUF3272 family protein [Streptococcus pacificus]